MQNFSAKLHFFLHISKKHCNFAFEFGTRYRRMYNFLTIKTSFSHEESSFHRCYRYVRYELR